MILSFVVGFLTLALAVSLYYNYKFATTIIKFEDNISEALDILDERYASISKILEIPLFYDSPQIRQVVTDMKLSRDSILKASNEISDDNVVEESSNA